MGDRKPVTEQSIATNNVSAVTSWAEARGQLEAASTYWLATVNPNGAPHVMPVLGVWSDGALYFTSGKAARKAKNLVRNPGCVITAAGKSLDLIVEGEGARQGQAPTRSKVVRVQAWMACNCTGWRLFRRLRSAFCRPASLRAL